MFYVCEDIFDAMVRLDAGYWMLDGYWILDVGCWMDIGYWILDIGCWMSNWSLEFLEQPNNKG